MKINGFLDDEERKEIKEFIKEMSKDKESEIVESGSLGVKISDRIGKHILFDVYTTRATVTMTKEEFKKLGKK